MSRVGVMHVVDTLDPGGAERVAVNLVNLLPRERYAPFLCTTRREGTLAQLVAADVGRLCLARRGRFDAAALLMARRFIRANGVRIVHAHGSSIFLGRLSTLLAGDARLVWHDHLGGQQFDRRPRWLYRLATTGIGGVISVSEELASWSRRVLGRPAGSVSYIPNFVALPPAHDKLINLPGDPGRRIVCVGNLRWQKNHVMLLKALALVVRRVPDAHLILVGGLSDADCVQEVERQIRTLSLTSNVSLMGYRPDVRDVLEGCDLAILSSVSEAFPLALLEYGSVGLASIATRVGQCDELLDHGRAGKLVASNDPAALAGAIVELLGDAVLRKALGAQFQERVQRLYAPGIVVNRVCSFYEQVLAA